MSLGPPPSVGPPGQPPSVGPPSVAPPVTFLEFVADLNEADKTREDSQASQRRASDVQMGETRTASRLLPESSEKLSSLSSPQVSVSSRPASAPSFEGDLVAAINAEIQRQAQNLQHALQAPVQANLDVIPTASRKRVAEKIATYSRPAPSAEVPGFVEGAPDPRIVARKHELAVVAAEESSFGIPLPTGEYPKLEMYAPSEVAFMGPWLRIAKKYAPPPPIPIRGSYTYSTFSVNIPNEVSTMETLQELITLYKTGNGVRTPIDVLMGLKSVGYFTAFGPLVNPEPLKTSEAAKSFLEGEKALERTLKILAIAGIWPYGVSISGKVIQELVSETTEAITNSIIRIPQNIFARVANIAAFATFFELGATQDPGDRNDDGFYYKGPQQCPLFNKYGLPKPLSAGAFGVVFRYSLNRLPSTMLRIKKEGKIDPSSLPDYVAVKVQQVEDETDPQETAHAELRVAYTIQRMTDHWSEERRVKPHGHVKLYDAFQCEFNPREHLGQIWTKAGKVGGHLLVDKMQINQIMVNEFVEEGNLKDLIAASETSLRRVMREDCFKNIFTQVLGHLAALGRSANYMHRDLSVRNVLVGLTKSRSDTTHLLYEGISASGRSLYVPLFGGDGMDGYILKVNDHGFARVDVMHQSTTGSSTREEIFSSTKKEPSRVLYNPARDLEAFAASFVGAVLDAVADNVPGDPFAKQRVVLELFTPEIAKALLACLHGDRHVTISYTELPRFQYSVYRRFLDLLANHRKRLMKEEYPNIISTVSDICKRIYVIYSRQWTQDVMPDDLAAIPQLFDLSIFDTLSTPPQDLSGALNMTDYKIAVFRLNM